MNTLGLTNELAVFFQTLPRREIDLDINYINSFSNLFFRFIAEVPGEGIVFPSINRLLVASLSDPIKELFDQSLNGIATSIITAQEYSTKIGNALDSIIDILPQVFEIPESHIVNIAQFNLSTDIFQLLNPVFINPASTSFDLANAIVQGFIIKLNSSTVVDSNSGATINWITN